MRACSGSRRFVPLVLVLSSCYHEELEWLRPEITEGEDLLVRTRVKGLPDIGGITQIVSRRPRARAREAFVVSGTKGAVFLDRETLVVEGHVNLNDGGTPYLAYHAVDADGDGTIEFLREPGAGESASLHDISGRLLWTAECPGGGFPHIAWGDIEGDGTLRFVFWSLGSRKVALVDPVGKEVWRTVWEEGPNKVIVLDIDGDHRAEILFTDGKALRTANGTGNVLWTHAIEGARYVNGLDLLSPEGGQVRVGVHFNEKLPSGELRQALRVYVLDRKGAVLVEEIDRKKLWDHLPESAAPSLALFPGEPPCKIRTGWVVEQAQIAGFSATGLNVMVLRANGEVAYRETLGASEGRRGKGEGALLAVTPRKGDPYFLVGFDEDLYVYRR